MLVTKSVIGTIFSAPEEEGGKRLQGVRLRDEFICPITYELLREPVVAVDGNTYEKAAIERWLRSKDTSPMNGSKLASKDLVPNHALKKLIQDLIDEGALGLYTKDSITNSKRKVDIYKERVLILKCLGPPEDNEWYMESFQVTPRGCIGGRRHSTKDTQQMSRDCIKFSDNTVSRRHFEIVTTAPGLYSIRDLGSAGGTFFRIPYGSHKELLPGMIIMLGKHQFIVSSIDHCDVMSASMTILPVPTAMSLPLLPEQVRGGQGARPPDKAPPSAERSIAMLVREAEELVKELTLHKERNNPADLERRLMTISSALKEMRAGVTREPGYDAIEPHKAPSKIENGKSSSDEKDLAKSGSCKSTSTDGRSEAKGVHRIASDDDKAFEARLKVTTTDEGEDASLQSTSTPPMSPGNRRDLARRRCIITCCAPECSPLIGQCFAIGADGGNIGRKPTCKVSLYRRVDTLGDGSFSGVATLDTAISAEHAMVCMDPSTGRFYVMDGNKLKGSTNGTWYRLSGPGQESPLYRLEANNEILFGTLRFQVSESITISERVVDDAPEISAPTSAAAF